MGCCLRERVDEQRVRAGDDALARRHPRGRKQRPTCARGALHATGTRADDRRCGGGRHGGSEEHRAVPGAVRTAWIRRLRSGLVRRGRGTRRPSRPRTGGFGSGSSRLELERLGFYACTEDLEDELIRAVGAERVVDIVEERSELGPFRTLRKQPEWRERPLEQQLRRFLGNSSRKIEYAPLLVEALVILSRAPRPLDAVSRTSEPRLSRVAERRSIQPHWRRDPLQLRHADERPLDLCILDLPHRLFGREDVADSTQWRSGGDVPVRASMSPSWKTTARTGSVWVVGSPAAGAPSLISSEARTTPCFGEQEHPSVAPPDGTPAVPERHAVDERAQTRGETSGRLVAVLLGEAGVPVRSTKQIVGVRSAR